MGGRCRVKPDVIRERLDLTGKGTTNSRKCKLIVLIPLMAVFFVVCASQAWAGSISWKGSKSTDWNDKGNWNPASSVPDSGDDVTIEPKTYQPTLSSNTTIKSLTLGTYSGTLLTLGSSTLTIVSDYNNLNWGTGNAFSPFARIDRTGGGQIRAANAGQTITGSGGAILTNGTTDNATLAFGNVHVGSTALIYNYNINNTGTSGGTKISGAIQTGGSTPGHITDVRLTGTGVIDANFGPINAAASSTSYAVAFTPSTAGLLDGQKVFIINNFANVQDQTLNITGAAYRYAAPSTISSTVNLGNIHVGDTFGTSALSLTNVATNDGYSESLNAAFGTLTRATGTGSVTGLAAGGPASTSLVVGLSGSTATAGARTGTAVVNFTSNGSGSSDLGLTPLDGTNGTTNQSQTVTVNGTVNNWANPVLSQTGGTGTLSGSGASLYS